MSEAHGQNILVFDSGLGGLSLVSQLRKMSPDATLIYLADNARFPYGDLSDMDVRDRVVSVVTHIAERADLTAAVIACNTASTITLDALRDTFSMPFVGTVPAIKPACDRSQTGLVSVLATPGTISRDYTQKLVDDFAGDVDVFLHGSGGLARMAEQKITGGQIDMDALKTEIEPVFRTHKGKRTDVVVLGCTHYPFLKEEMQKASPWPVTFMDTSEAIARRLSNVIAPLGAQNTPHTDQALLTTKDSKMAAVLARFGFEKTAVLSV